MEIENIIFDFNGTILDDLDICYQLLNEMLIMSNHPPVSKDKYLHIFTFPVYDYYKKAGFNFDKEPKDDFKELSSYFVKHYYAQFDSLQVFHDVLFFFKEHYNKYNLYLLSATKESDLVTVTKKLDIYKYFKKVMGTNDIYASSKLEIAESYFTKNPIDFNKTMFIGDTLHDNEIAKRFNSISVLIDRGHQAKDVLASGNPNYLLNNMDQVISILEGGK